MANRSAWAHPHRHREHHHAPAPYTHGPSIARSKLKQEKFLRFSIPRVDVSEIRLSVPKDPSPAPPAPAEAHGCSAIAHSCGAPLALSSDESAWEAVNAKLAKAKSLFDAIPPKEFNTHMYALDLFAGLKRIMREQYGMFISTNASLKMSEIIVRMGLFPRDKEPQDVKAFCNAELPGAFIVAINHYLHTRYRQAQKSFDWVACSYYPEVGSDALGDDYGLYRGNREHWLMGPRPNALPEGMPCISGDVTDPDVLEAVELAVKARFGGEGATLYTSDVGTGVAEDFNRQEELTSALNLGQVLSGLMTLRTGGCLVTKQYTFCTPFSRSLIAIVAAHFDSLHVVKPQTSRPANSEVYIVGTGYRGIEPAVRDRLLLCVRRCRESHLHPSDLGSLITTIPEEIDRALLRAAQEIHGEQQVAFVKEAIQLYEKYQHRSRMLLRELAPLADRLQKDWLERNEPDFINPLDQLATLRDDDIGRTGWGREEISAGEATAMLVVRSEGKRESGQMEGDGGGEKARGCEREGDGHERRGELENTGDVPDLKKTKDQEIEEGEIEVA